MKKNKFRNFINGLCWHHQRLPVSRVHAVGDKAVKVTIDGFINAIQTCLARSAATMCCMVQWGSRRFRQGGEIRHYLCPNNLPSVIGSIRLRAPGAVCGNQRRNREGAERYHRPWRHGGGRPDGIMISSTGGKWCSSGGHAHRRPAARDYPPRAGEISVADGVRMRYQCGGQEFLVQQVLRSIEVRSRFSGTGQDIFSVPHEASRQ